MAKEVRCVVLECSWSIDVTPPDVPAGMLAEIFGPGVVAASHAHAEALRRERETEQHLKSHSVIEWVNTVNYWRGEYAKQVNNLIEVTEAFTSAAR